MPKVNVIPAVTRTEVITVQPEKVVLELSGKEASGLETLLALGTTFPVLEQLDLRDLWHSLRDLGRSYTSVRFSSIAKVAQD